MNIFKKRYFTLLLITFFHLEASANDSVNFLSKDYLITILLNFIQNNYWFCLAIILFVTFVLDFDYYVQNRLQIKHSKFSMLIALIGIIFCTIIKLFY